MALPSPFLAEPDKHAPLTDSERRDIEKLLSPEIIREILKTAVEYKREGKTDHMDLRLHWVYGDTARATWSRVQATTFQIKRR